MRDPAPSALGILMLDTAFERPPGDVGHPATWPFPILVRRIEGATARRVVGGDDADLIERFVAAGEALAAEGAVGLITSCGFLAAHQPTLAHRLSIPIATSSLLLVPVVERCLPGRRRVGVVSYDAASLGPRHFAGVGAAVDTPVIGLPADGHLHAVIEGGARLEPARVEAEVVDAVGRLLADHPEVGAIVLECTNLPPHAAAVERTFGLPVHDVVTLGIWFHSGLGERRYTARGPREAA
jgi:hypothetical protein